MPAASQSTPGMGNLIMKANPILIQNSQLKDQLGMLLLQ
jgi:hypothetical protein